MSRFGRIREVVICLGLVLGGLFFSLVVSEAALRVWENYSEYYVWKPNLKKRILPSEGRLPGVSGEKMFSINSRGIRGDEFSREKKYHILAAGGSTTECLYLDDQEAWPYKTQMLINQEENYSVWIGNVGKSGARMANHINDIKKLIKQYPFMDALILLVGVNDHWYALANTLEEKSEPEKKSHSSKAALNSSDIPFYKKTSLWKLARKVKKQFSQDKNMIQDVDALWIERVRKNRWEAEKIDELPPLSESLWKYDKELRALVEFLKRKQVRIIFMTQPTLWREDLNEEEDRLLCFGWGGQNQLVSKRYYTARALVQSMRMFNDALLSVCSDYDLECIPLDNLLEKDLSVFYDDCHFNESGSLKIAEILSSYLMNEAPVKLPLKE